MIRALLNTRITYPSIRVFGCLPLQNIGGEGFSFLKRKEGHQNPDPYKTKKSQCSQSLKKST